jgi:DNA-binding LytR/AlgR family response regulator
VGLEPTRGLSLIGIQTLVHAPNSIHETGMYLNEMEGILPQNFQRTHKSFIVNTDKIKSIREVSRRSYEIEFYGYNLKDHMSRYKYKEHKESFFPSR